MAGGLYVATIRMSQQTDDRLGEAAWSGEDQYDMVRHEVRWFDTLRRSDGAHDISDGC